MFEFAPNLDWRDPRFENLNKASVQRQPDGVG
jgi:hypothetical protein